MLDGGKGLFDVVRLYIGEGNSCFFLMNACLKVVKACIEIIKACVLIVRLACWW